MGDENLYGRFNDTARQYEAHQRARHNGADPDEAWDASDEDEPVGDPRWLSRAMLSKENNPLSNLANVMLALRQDPGLHRLLTYDEMECSPVLTHPVPISGRPMPHPFPIPRLARDEDATAVQEYLQHAGLKHVGEGLVSSAMRARARERSFHPIRSYLDGLVWDGTPKVDHWLTVCFGVEPSPYVAAVARMSLIALVARIYRPGCKLDYMLVLEGEQAAEKSKALRVLGEPWFSDNLPDIHTKDARQHLRGKWIIEVAELSAVRRAESEYLKSFVTRQEEIYRPPFGRLEVREPRQCAFFGSTNKDTYLQDETGGRRFWPVKTVRVDIDALKRDRDQLFAEAMTLFKLGIPWWPDRAFEREHIKPEQESRFEVDAWEDAIRDYLATGKTKIQVSDVARKALRFETNRIGTADTRRITAAMERHGWTRDNDGRPDWQGKRWWVRA